VMGMIMGSVPAMVTGQYFKSWQKIH